MTPEQKAKELVEKFKAHSYYDAHDLTTRFEREESNIESAKECALIAVEEIIVSHTDNLNGDNLKEKEYWQQVKTEIEKVS